MSVCGHWHPTPEPCTVVSLGDIEMVSSGAGLYGLTSPIDGWANSGTSPGGPASWATADGGIMGDAWFQGRSLTIEGDIEARDHAEYAEAVERLGAVLTYPRTGVLRVDEVVHLGLVRQIEVTRTRPVQISALGHAHGIFTIQLEAADFVRTDVDLQSVTVPTGGVDVRNIGTAPAATTARLVGPLTNPGLSWPGGSWSYQGSVASGQTILVEMWRRRVVDEATATHSRMRAQGSWLAVAPGTRNIKRTGSGSGRVELEWRSSWA